MKSENQNVLLKKLKKFIKSLETTDDAVVDERTREIRARRELRSKMQMYWMFK